MNPTINELVEAARLHFNHLQADITNASTRIEHIRLTTLAQEAENLLISILNFQEKDPSQLQTNAVSSSAASAGAAIPSACICSNCTCAD